MKVLRSSISVGLGSSHRIYPQQCVGAMACGHLIQHSMTAQQVSNVYNLARPALVVIGLLVDCGQPEFPSNGVVSTLSSTTEGATVTFQCEKGLFPSDPITSTCSSTGQWTVKCSTSGICCKRRVLKCCHVCCHNLVIL